MGKDAPAAPDYRAAAEEQGQASKELTEYQTWANRPNLFTPWGSQTWEYSGGSPGGSPGSTPSSSFDQAGYDRAMRDYQFSVINYNPEVGGPNPIGSPPTREQFTTTGGSTGSPGSSGPGTWTSRITLSPDQQAALDSQMRIQAGRSDAAEKLLGQASTAFDTPMNWDALPALSTGDTLGQGGADWRQRGQSAIEELMAPQLDARRGSREADLASRGITMGSRAWDTAMRQLGDDETRAGLMAIDAGRGEADSIFSKDMQRAQFGNTARQQALAEMLQKRGQPLNELTALLTGQQVSMPGMPSFNPAGRAETPNYLGAAQSQYQSSLDAFNASQAGLSGLMSGLGGLGSAAIQSGGWGGLFALSDARLKRDISHVFTLPNGIKIYKYRFIGNDRFELGVLAQEVQQIMPEAVAIDEKGFLRVNYNMVLGDL